jgi:hypothetical protein
MMTWLLEDSLPVIVMGVILIAALAVGFIKTGSRAPLYGLAFVILLLIGLVLLERMVVTDREQVEDVLFTIAKAVERNDIDEAIRHISPEAPGVQHADRELRRVNFREVDIKPNLEIEVFADRSPPTAEARFNVVVVGDIGGGPQRYPRYVEVTFEKQGERWVARDYQHYEPTHSMRIRDNGP